VPQRDGSGHPGLSRPSGRVQPGGHADEPDCPERDVEPAGLGLLHAHAGAGMLTVTAPSGTGAPAAVTPARTGVRGQPAQLVLISPAARRHLMPFGQEPGPARPGHRQPRHEHDAAAGAADRFR
jgi:hypothetical protein